MKYNSEIHSFDFGRIIFEAQPLLTAKTTLSGQGYGFCNIAIATALLPSSFGYCIVNIK